MKQGAAHLKECDTTPPLGAVAYTQRVHMRLVLRLHRLMRAHGKCSVKFVNAVSRFGSLTTCARAGGCAGSHYPFLTLKERDVETGLGFFEARYYANVQGRFTSPDPLFFQKEMLLDPQRFNLYAYVRNNPLKLVDPNGLAIELTGDEAERKRKLDLIRQSVGKEAGAYLYENKAKDGKYYVGIYNDGKSKPFEQVNSVAGDFAKVINDTYVAQVQFVPQDTLVQVQGGMARIGTLDRISGATPGASYVDQYGRATIYLLDPGTDPGKLPPILMSDGNPQQLILSDVLAHETAHVEARWGHTIGPSNTKCRGSRKSCSQIA